MSRPIQLCQEWKERVLKKDNYTCQDCGSFGGPLDAHHIVSWIGNVNLRFDPDNGIALCPLCHGKRHGHSRGFIRNGIDARSRVQMDENSEGMEALFSAIRKQRQDFMLEMLESIEMRHRQEETKRTSEIQELLNKYGKASA